MRNIRKRRYRQPSQQEGFTLLEILIITPILMVTVISIITGLFTLYGEFFDRTRELNMQTDLKTASFVMQDDMTFASTYLTRITNSNSRHIDDPNEPPGKWRINSALKPLIMKLPAMTAHYRDGARQQVYFDTHGCVPDVSQADMETNEKAYYDVVYFLKDGTLYRRALVPPTTVDMCGTPYLKQNCPAHNASDTCPSDRVLATHVTDFAITYYAPNNLEVNVPESANKVTLSITQTDTTSNGEISNTTTFTMKRLGE